MRILLLSETLHAGGAETFVLRLARKLRELGEECDVLNLSPDIENARLLETFADLNILRVHVPAPIWVRRIDRLLVKLGIAFSLQSWLSLRAVARDHLRRYDIFHTHLFKTDLLMARAKARLPHLRFVSTLHGDYQIFHERRGERVAGWQRKMRLLNAQCDGWVYIADRQADLLIREYGFPPWRLHKIYNGFEPGVETPAPARTEGGAGLVFVMVARGIRDKGWDFAIDAFRALPPGSRLLLVGEGPHLDTLRSMHGDEPGVEFVGFHPNPIEIIRQADAFVFPSVYPAESLPTVLIESLYCGVPVISTAIGEVPSMLASESGELCGQLIEAETPEAITQALAQAMQCYLSDRALLARHAALTGDAFRKFDMTACAKRYRALYRSVLSS